MTFFSHNCAPDMRFFRSGAPGGSAVFPAAPSPHSGPRLGALLASVRQRLSGVFVRSPAFFEICNRHTGEPAVGLGLFTDGTLADRAARDLGQDWRVFRQKTSADQKQRSACGAASEPKRSAESYAPIHVTPPADKRRLLSRFPVKRAAPARTWKR